MPNKTAPTTRPANKRIQAPDSGDRIRGTEPDFLTRLERASQDVDANRDALKAAVELRDELLVEAHDQHGMTTTAIARAAHLSQSRVVEILASH